MRPVPGEREADNDPHQQNAVRHLSSSSSSLNAPSHRCGHPRGGDLERVASRAEVDALLAQAKAAGATLTDEPHERPWGIYSGYFRDPDGHLWEIIWNPRRA
ncbi:MAG: hypothetical protein E6G36_11055 [Actinobacteria bacterium]|nr:MAG: hypothetical protein E6G36_11055 [Actinomycetota bacterium]